MEKTHTSIEHLLGRKKPGDLVFAADFRGKGTDAAIRKTLSRLVSKGTLKRAAQGVYYIPEIDPVLGELHPGAEDIAQKIAEKEKVRIRPTGAYALNKLGLSTQVPMKIVYLTDGVPRTLKVGKATIKFIATTTKRLSTKGQLSGLIILALEELNLKHIDQQEEKRILDLLSKENPKHLQHDLKLAPARIHDYIVKLLKKSA